MEDRSREFDSRLVSVTGCMGGIRDGCKIEEVEDDKDPKDKEDGETETKAELSSDDEEEEFNEEECAEEGCRDRGGSRVYKMPTDEK